MSPAKKLSLMVVLIIGYWILNIFVFPSPSQAQTSTFGKNCSDPGILNTIVYDIGCKTALGGDDKADQACKALQCALENADAQPPSQKWYNPTLREFSKKVFDSSPDNEIFGERYTYAQVNWIVNSMFTMLLPKANKMQDVIALFDAIKALQSYKIPPQLQPLAKAIDFPFTHPVASARTEGSKLLSIFGVIPTAQAQGIGYGKLTSGLGRISTLWTATRNMAYLVSIILLIASGFMVMFKSKINPQMVVTVQMIIPRLAISLLLITFSFAIVGLAIDMIYVFIAAIVGLFQTMGISTNLAGNITALTSANTSYISNLFLWWYLFWVLIIVIFMLVLQNIALPLGGLAYTILAILLGLLVWSVIAMVRIIATLFSAYVNLIILAITGPLQIMIDIIPSGKNAGFVPWFKCVIGNASVFVITAVLVIAAQVFFDFGSNQNQLSLLFTGIDPNFNLPFVGNGGIWILGDITRLGDTGARMGWLLGGIFLPMVFFGAMPNLMNSLKNVLCKGEDPSQQIANAINDMIKQLTGGKAYELKKPSSNEPDFWKIKGITGP